MMELLEKSQEQGGYICMTLESSECSSTSHVSEIDQERGGFQEESIKVGIGMEWKDPTKS